MIKKITKGNKYLKYITNKLKNTHLRKSQISYYALIKTFIAQIKNHDVDMRARSMAFSFLLAVFPGIIFLFTLIPYAPIPDLREQVMAYIEKALPDYIYNMTAATIDDIVSKKRSGLLSFGFLFALYAATSGTNSMIETFNQSYRTLEKRSFLKARLIAVCLTLLLVFILFTSVVVLIVGQVTLDYMVVYLQNISFYKSKYIYIMLNFFQFSVMTALFFVSISSIYYLGPQTAKKWGFISTGSFFTTILSILFTFGFSFYFSNFNTYNKLYGSIGALLGFLLWLYVISLLILLGFELNTSLDQLKHPHKKKIPNRSE